MSIHPLYSPMKRKQEQLLNRKNSPCKERINSPFYRYRYPLLTNEHVPLHWRYDLSNDSNPHFLERLGINTVFNAGAIKWNHRYYLMVRIEGVDRKSFFAIASSLHPDWGFRFHDDLILIDDAESTETNVYDMRLTLHEDGWIYGIFCSESKDPKASLGDSSSAVARAGIVRTKNMMDFERLPDLVTPSPQQRNVTLHPEFVNGNYLLYTRPQDGFIETGAQGGIAYGFVKTMSNPVITEEKLLDEKRYHTVYELKNGCGPSPIKTKIGWLHIAHGVRNTAAGLRYVLYAFLTDLSHPETILRKPSGYLLAPLGDERVGDVSNVVFSNGIILDDDQTVYLYYASSDTRLHVARVSLEVLLDYVINTPEECYRSVDCVRQRKALIQKNNHLLKEKLK